MVSHLFKTCGGVELVKESGLMVEGENISFSRDQLETTQSIPLKSKLTPLFGNTVITSVTELTVVIFDGLKTNANEVRFTFPGEGASMDSLILEVTLLNGLDYYNMVFQVDVSSNLGRQEQTIQATFFTPDDSDYGILFEINGTYFKEK